MASSSSSSLPNLEKMVITSDSSKDSEERKPRFVESLKLVEALAVYFECVNCFKMPDLKVFTLGGCLHKYCELCVEIQAGKPCVICGAKAYPKDAKQDLFSTNVLKEIPKVYHSLKRFQNQHENDDEKELFRPGSPPVQESQKNRVTKEGGKGGDDDSDCVIVATIENNDEEQGTDTTFDPLSEVNRGGASAVSLNEGADILENEPKSGRSRSIQVDGKEGAVEENNEVIDNIDIYEFNECTPQGQILPTSPDVLEETPQHKPRLSIYKHDASKKKRERGGRTLHLDLGNQPLTSVAKPGLMDLLNSTSEEEKEELFIKPVASRTPLKKLEDEVVNSDEELFRSQQSVSGETVKVNKVNDLPVLTPYAKNPENHEGSKFANKLGPNLNRSFGDNDLPNLTPYGKSKAVEPTVDSTAKENSKQPTSGRGRRRITISSTSTVESSSSSTSQSKDLKVTENKKKIATKKTVPNRARRRGSANSKSMSHSETIELDSDLENKSKRALGSSRKRRASVCSSFKDDSLPPSSPTPSSLNDSLSSLRGKKEKRNANGETALHVACRGGQVEKVKNLLENGFDVDAKDYAGWTPLHELINSKKASLEEKLELIQSFHEKECNLNAVGGPEDETVLHSAAELGLEKVVELLLNLGASPNIRTKSGRLPVDGTFNDNILQLLNEKSGRSSRGDTSLESISNDVLVPGQKDDGGSTSNYESALTTGFEEDPAVLRVMIEKAVVYFNFDLSKDDAVKITDVLNLRVTDKLTGNVTHVIHDINEERKVSMSLEYLFALAHGMWQVSYEWIQDSMRNSSCLFPTRYEIVGCNEDKEAEISSVPFFCRVNHDKGNPGLFNGFTFYLYKTCGYASENLDLLKKDLLALIVAAGGRITNREPNPNEINPLESLKRFHVKMEDSSSPFTLTTHLIIYDDKAPPPKNKKYNMEHVKSLKSDWLIECIANFKLVDPTKYL